MYAAPVGDDCYGDDPSVRRLEEITAGLLGKEAAIFLPSGTMANQVAIRAHTKPGDEIITDSSYHIAFFEAAQTACLGGVTLNCCSSRDGLITIDDIEEAVSRRPRGPLYAPVRLISIENTVAATGGRILPIRRAKRVYGYAKERGYSVHLDGARLFNAAAAAGVAVSDFAKYSDSVSVCFAKGLGAPFGSALAGSRSFIERARVFRKWYGGALHQAGIMAAAALFALENNLQRLAEDHRLAAQLAEQADRIPGLSVDRRRVETNIVLLDVRKLGVSPTEFVECARRCGVLLFPWVGKSVRAITHMGIDEVDVEEAILRLRATVDRLGERESILMPATSPRHIEHFIPDVVV